MLDLREEDAAMWTFRKRLSGVKIRAMQGEIR